MSFPVSIFTIWVQSWKWKCDCCQNQLKAILERQHLTEYSIPLEKFPHKIHNSKGCLLKVHFLRIFRDNRRKCQNLSSLSCQWFCYSWKSWHICAWTAFNYNFWIQGEKDEYLRIFANSSLWVAFKMKSLHTAVEK